MNNYDINFKFLKSLGLIPTGFNGQWIINDKIINVDFIDNKIIISNI